jgi:hypothetical protein
MGLGAGWMPPPLLCAHTKHTCLGCLGVRGARAEFIILYRRALSLYFHWLRFSCALCVAVGGSLNFQYAHSMPNGICDFEVLF